MKFSYLNVARAAFLLLLLTAIVLILVEATPVLLAAVVAVSLLLYLLVRKHATATVFVCPECSQKFRISAWIDFISPHTFDKKWLSCPGCGRQFWCKIE